MPATQDVDIHPQLLSLSTKLKETTHERDEAVARFNENEEVWTSKHTKLEKDKRNLLEINQSLKDDNKDLLMQIDKYLKRIRQLENEAERELDKHRHQELAIHDYKREIITLKDQMDYEKSETAKQSKRMIEM